MQNLFLVCQMVISPLKKKVFLGCIKNKFTVRDSRFGRSRRGNVHITFFFKSDQDLVLFFCCRRAATEREPVVTYAAPVASLRSGFARPSRFSAGCNRTCLVFSSCDVASAVSLHRSQTRPPLPPRLFPPSPHESRVCSCVVLPFGPGGLHRG